MSTAPGSFQLAVAPSEAGVRLDVFVSRNLPDCSRSHAAHLIEQGYVLVAGTVPRPAYRLKNGETVQVHRPPPAPVDIVPEPIAFTILYEDASLIVVDKPPGLVVHPAAGHAVGTLVNGLLHHCRDLQGIGGEQRPGIVHRLDKDTSGLLVVAKNDPVHQNLSRQFKERRIRKEYQALVWGAPDQESGMIDRPIGRHATERKRMAVVDGGGREALTLWRVRERLPEATLLDVEIRTGRTHQIRVHCQFTGHPIVGDPVYGRHRRTHRNKAFDAVSILEGARRQMLHAARLAFTHPLSGLPMAFEAPLASDMAGILAALRTLG